MFYDFLCAESVVGQFDNCLFSLHKPQTIGRTNDKDLESGDWGRRVSRAFLNAPRLTSFSPVSALTA